VQVDRKFWKRAEEKGVSTVAFPNISTGIFGFPKTLAAEIAVREVKVFFKNRYALKEVIFCCFDEENFELYKRMGISS
jgi:O-acetyl-ADP-ribose deacetylase